MTDTVNKQALLSRLNELYDCTGDRAEKYAYGRVEQEVLSCRFDSTQPTTPVQENYTEADIHTALTCELTDERVATAAAYWLDASPHERWVPDGLILARYARFALDEIHRLKTATPVQGYREALEEIKRETDSLIELDLVDSMANEDCIRSTYKIATEALSQPDIQPRWNCRVCEDTYRVVRYGRQEAGEPHLVYSDCPRCIVAVINSTEDQPGPRTVHIGVVGGGGMTTIRKLMESWKPSTEEEETE